jgi:hypothetical protein
MISGECYRCLNQYSVSYAPLTNHSSNIRACYTTGCQSKVTEETLVLICDPERRNNEVSLVGQLSSTNIDKQWDRRYGVGLSFVVGCGDRPISTI